MVGALVKWLEYPAPVQESPGSIPARVRQNSFTLQYLMDVMNNPPMTCLTLNETKTSDGWT